MTDQDLAETLWEQSEKLRGQVEPSEYKYVTLSILFLRNADLTFTQVKEDFKTDRNLDEDDIQNSKRHRTQLENTVKSEGGVYLPEDARWNTLLNTDQQLPKAVDNALEQIETENTHLTQKDLPSSRFERIDIDHDTVNDLLQAFSDITIQESEKDVVGNIYEYFIREFAKGTAQGDGEFYTPRDIVELIVDCVRPINGRVFDPCAGTGGMFIQSYKYADSKQHVNADNLSFYGQEYNASTAKLGRMNLLLHGLSDAEFRIGNSLTNDKFEGEKFDKIITNPPFNYTYEKDKVTQGERFKYGLPNEQNANYAFMQHMLHHTKNGGLVGTVMANGALANTADEDIRKELVENDHVDAVITLPEELFYTVSIPVSVFILSNGKGMYNDDHRNREGETLFIDASDMFESIDRSENRLKDSHISKIATTVQKYRGEFDGEIHADDYEDVEEFCKVATTDEIAETNYNLNPGRYISFNTDTNHTPLDVRLPELRGQIEAKFNQSRELESNIMEQLSKLKQNDDESEVLSDKKQSLTQGDTE